MTFEQWWTEHQDDGFGIREFTQAAWNEAQRNISLVAKKHEHKDGVISITFSIEGNG